MRASLRAEDYPMAFLPVNRIPARLWAQPPSDPSPCLGTTSLLLCVNLGSCQNLWLSWSGFPSRIAEMHCVSTLSRVWRGSRFIPLGTIVARAGSPRGHPGRPLGRCPRQACFTSGDKIGEESQFSLDNPSCAGACYVRIDRIDRRFLKIVPPSRGCRIIATIPAYRPTHETF